MSTRFSSRSALFASLFVAALVFPAFASDPSDPFDASNKAVVLNARSRKIVEIINFDVKLSTPKAKRGEVVRVTLTGKPAAGFYTYPITQRTNEQSKPDVAITYSRIDGIKPLWPIEESSPHLGISLDGKVSLHHDGEFTWSQDLLIDAAAKPGQQDLGITIRLMVCNKGGCFGPDIYRPIYVPLEILEGEPIVPTKELLDRTKGPPDLKVITPSAEQLAKARAESKKAAPPGKAAPAPDGKKVAPPSGDVDAHNLWSFLWFACVSAFLMLLTPCVFPMIPITVNFFIKQSEKEHHNPLSMACVYSGTIIVLLTTIMLALGSVIIAVANNEWFNLALGVILIVFALSLFGMYEIELPHFLARFTSAREGQGGLVGAIFMAMTFTITSFTCTGPFLGLMLGSVAGVKPPLINLILGALVYSTTFAAPFFVLALFPSMLKKLPKSGGWLNAVKVTMGFLEIGAALKFLSNADLAFFPGNPQIFNYDTVLAAWMALSVACALYLFGVYRLPHDDQIESIGVGRMLVGVSFLGLAVYLAPAMFGIKPAGFIGDNVVAFLPIRTGHENDAFGSGGGTGKDGGSGHKDWHLDYEEAWKEAVASDKLLFIDFTGQNCANCRWNENTVFVQPQVKAKLNQFVKASLYTDSVPDRKLSSAKAKELAEKYYGFQDKLADPTLPYYLIIKPAKDAPLDKGLPKGEILGREKGQIINVPAFVELLENALANQPRAAHLRIEDAVAEAAKKKGGS